jgi:predicted aconitase with swiveling domain
VTTTFTGRPVLAGDVSGAALVTRHPFNTLASFIKCLTTGAKKAVCSDQDNPDLYGKVLTGALLCLPQTIGSTAAGLILETAIHRDVAPAALLFSESIDTLAASGAILADVWVGKRIVVVDRLGPEFLDAVSDGRTLRVQEDGTVTVA